MEHYFFICGFYCLLILLCRGVDGNCGIRGLDCFSGIAHGCNRINFRIRYNKMANKVYHNCDISIYYNNVKGMGGRDRSILLVRHTISGNSLCAVSFFEAETIARLLNLDYVLSSVFYPPDDSCIDGG